ncbi:hypothetical protein RND81_08G018700 [Saponaria officinalis]|uniref:Bifunctional inhibitor/plant lipid transfer protein/seed storage helical domain-containing protein n=1 Tax=Saponaria officinalis TaxID=3572 RepID=A0AAW1J388_SAPOF
MTPKMISRTVMILTLASVVVMMADGAASNAAPSSVDCMTVTATSMLDCVSYISNGSTIAKPQGGCCNGLKLVLNTHPECLCEVAKQGAAFDINITKAATLPTACGIHDAPVSKCGVISPPASAPVVPAVSPSTENAPSTTPATNETTSPTPAPSKSDSKPDSSSSPSFIGVSDSLLIAGLAASLFASF